MDIFTLLAFLPIVTLLIISLWLGVRVGVYVGFAITAVLFFVFDSTLVTFLASVISAFVGTINILMIIFGAVFLYHVMEQKAYIAGIKQSLSAIHPDKTFRFFFLSFFLTAFFESIAGFGTPGAIVPLLLIALGFSPVRSIAVVLLIDGLFALTGAVGTPVIAGLAMPLKLDATVVGQIYTVAGFMVFAAGLVITFFIGRIYKKDVPEWAGKAIWILYLSIMVPYLLCSFFARELSGLVASMIMGIFSYLFLFKNKQLDWKPWIPYWVLVLLLLLPKIVTPLAGLLTYSIDFTSILDTEVSASLQPLKTPLIPFLLASLFALIKAKDYKLNVQPIFTKTLGVFLVLFPSLAITQLMLNSGTDTSMIDLLANTFVKVKEGYPVLSPLIGVLGAFVSGSTTVSNIIFGPIQYSSAEQLGLAPQVILGLQLAGASLGNAICLFNIIAAAAVAGVKDYAEVLKLNVLPVLFASITCAVLGYILIALFH